MALVLVVETGAGLATANSYATLAESETYFESRLHKADWTAASDANKEAALVWATRLLDQQVDWKGTPSTVDQALRWPRTGVLTRDGNEFEDFNIIPQWLKDATAEFAFWLIQEDRTADDDTKGFRSIRAGSVALEIDKSDRKTILPRGVAALVDAYGTVAGSGMAKLARV